MSRGAPNDLSGHLATLLIFHTYSVLLLIRLHALIISPCGHTKHINALYFTYILAIRVSFKYLVAPRPDGFPDWVRTFA